MFEVWFAIVAVMFTGYVVLDGYDKALETARLTAKSLVAVTVTSDLALELAAEDFTCPVLAMQRIVRPPFAQPPELRATGPLFVVN